MWNPWANEVNAGALATNYSPRTDAECAAGFDTWWKENAATVPAQFDALVAYDARFPGRCTAWVDAQKITALALAIMPPLATTGPGANANSDAACAASFLTFKAANADKYRDDSSMIAAFSATSPACSAWVLVQLAALRSANYAQSTPTLSIDVATDASCLETWNTYVASLPGGAAGFATQTAAQTAATIATFRAANPGCAGWLDRQLATRPPSTTSGGGGSMLLVLAAAAAIALLASGKKMGL